MLLQVAHILVSLGAAFAPGEIGRGVNATGGETLIASLGDALISTLHAGVESRHAGLELSVGVLGRAVRVDNELGTPFPHHGRRPATWTAALRLFPLSVLTQRALPAEPWVALGGGGMVLSADLDNVNDQTLYHRWQWSLGAGVRVPLSERRWDPETVLDLRVTRMRVGARAPFQAFDVVAAMVGLGLRF
ncbi:MAG: hypothetical protein ACRENB_05355 [Gemmatimonadales bacterium]